MKMKKKEIGGKYLYYLYLMKNFHPEYMKYLHNAITTEMVKQK